MAWDAHGASACVAGAKTAAKTAVHNPIGGPASCCTSCHVLWRHHCDTLQLLAAHRLAVQVVEQKGLDIVRRDWCALSKDVGNYVLGHILSGQPREEVVHAIHLHLQEVRAQHTMSSTTCPPMDLVLRCRCACSSAVILHPFCSSPAARGSLHSLPGQEDPAAGMPTPGQHCSSGAQATTDRARPQVPELSCR